MINPSEFSIKKIQSHFEKKELKPSDLVSAGKKIVDEKNTLIHAFLEVYPDLDKVVKSTEEIISKGGSGPLQGVTIALKDNILVEGKTASAGSKILEHFVSPYDSTAVSKLKSAGAILFGRTNMDEFAMGSSTENSAFGVTRNPYDTSRVPGGSSGGAAAAVAMGAVVGALGSDTGGSVRQPAAFCGVVGLKPTYGAISRYGLIAMGSSLDQIGPITKKVKDAEIIFNVLKGTDAKDSTSYYPEKKEVLPEKLKIGVPKDLMAIEGLSKEVEENFKETIEKLKKLGYEIVDIELPNAKYSLAVYYILMPAEVSSNLARFDGVKYGMHINGKDLIEDYFLTRGKGFGKEVRRRVMLGTYVLSAGYYDAFYGKANALRYLIRKDYENAFNAVHAILTPTTPTPAFKIGEKSDDPLAMYLADIFTVPANITGNPAISIPSGFAEQGGSNLPLGVQLVANHYREDILFKIGKDFLGEEK